MKDQELRKKIDKELNKNVTQGPLEILDVSDVDDSSSGLTGASSPYSQDNDMMDISDNNDLSNNTNNSLESDSNDIGASGSADNGLENGSKAYGRSDQESDDSPKSGGVDETSKEKGDSAANEIKNMFDDNKNKKLEKHDAIDSGLKNDKPYVPENVKDAAKDLKDKAQPIIDDAKEKLNEVKEQGKDAAAKAGGKAIQTLSKGVIPSKVGEWATKKVLDNTEKKIKKKAHALGNNIKNQASNLKDKIDDNEHVQKAKQTAGKAVKAGAKAIKTVKTLDFIRKWGPVILAGIAVLLVIASFCVAAELIASYLPGVFGDVKKIEEDSTGAYTKRDIKILDNIEEIVDKYPAVSTDKAAYVMATVSYPYHVLLQGDNAKSLAGKEESEDEETDSYELLFEPDNELTAKEKYEKYKLVFASGLEAGKEVIESEFKEWLADKFGYEPSEDDDEDEEDGKIYNDIYLTMYKKDKYLEKFDKLMKVYNDNGEDGFNQYLIDEYYDEDDGYKSLLEVNDDVKEELINDIQKDVSENADLYKNYIPLRKCSRSSWLTSLGTKDTGNYFANDLYVTLRDYRDTNGTFIKEDYYAAPVLYGTDTEPLTFKRYIMGVMYAELSSCVDNEVCAKTFMITAKSYTLGRQSRYDTEYLDDKTILHMRGNVGDQDFCDIYEGCQSGRFSKETWTVTGEGSKSTKPAASQEQIAKLEEWWDDVSDEYLMTSEGAFVGPHYSNYNDNCKKGSCLSQTDLRDSSLKESDYLNLLFDPSKGGFDDTNYVLYKSSDSNVYAAGLSEDLNCVSNECGVSPTRDGVVTYARSLVGKIKYYFGGKPNSKNFEENDFGTTVAPDSTQGRTIRGLDCSGFIDFVFWHVMDENFGNGNTSEIRDIYSEKISYDDLKPGDLGFLDMTGSGTNQHVGIYAGKDEDGNDIWIDCNPNGVQERNTSIFKVYFRPKIFEETDNSNTNICESDGATERVCKKYNLSDSELAGLAGIAYKEQGSPEGAKAEASLMANKYELDNSSKTLYNYVNDSGWWASASKGSTTNNKEVLDAVKDALVNGNRSFPSYVNEHDCISCGTYGFDIIKLVVGNKTYTSSEDLLNHDNYKKDQTVIYNKYGSKYTFYSFPTKGSDPFGYTSKKKDTCKSVSAANSDGVVTTKSTDLRGSKFYAPVQKKLTMYGYENGVRHDLAADCGSPLYAPASGTATYKTITKNGKVASYGNVIYIKTTDGYEIRLGHLQSFEAYKVKFGIGANYPSSCKGGRCNTYTYGSKAVKEGELLGYTGTSGNSTGCHLHIELRNSSGTRLNPPSYFGY